jgi:hypothetical protein
MASGTGSSIGAGNYYTSSIAFGNFYLPVTMRATPTVVVTTGTDYYTFLRNGTTDAVNVLSFDACSPQTIEFKNDTQASGTAGQAGFWRTSDASSFFAAQSEL